MKLPKRLTAFSLLLLSEWAIATSLQAAPSRPISTQSSSISSSTPSQPFLLSQRRPSSSNRLRSRRWLASPRRWGAPRWSSGGAARGGCNLTESPLVPLMPVADLADNYSSFSAITVDAHPTFFAYVPRTSARAVEFLLIDEETGNVLYEPSPLPVNGTPQVVSFRYDSNLPPLELDKTYTWYFTIVCNSAELNRPDMDDNSGNPYVRGWVQRIAPDPTLTTTLASTALRDRPSIYAQAGIWLDTLNSLATLRCMSPDDTALASDWADLMQSLDLTRIPDMAAAVEQQSLGQAPLAQCAQ